MGNLNAQKKFQESVILEGDKSFLKTNIFDALDSVVHMDDKKGKVVVSSIENIIYNIAQLEYATWGPSVAQQAIHQRLTSNDERYQMSGLRALKSIVQAFEFEIDNERKYLHELVEIFFPVLEGLLGNNELQNS